MDDNIAGRAFTLYLCRHGESMTNIDGLPENSPLARYPPLSQRGERQAELLGGRFGDVPLSAVFSSGFERAAATAHSIIKKQPAGGCEKIFILPDLSECGELGDESSLEGLCERHPAVPAPDVTIPPLFPDTNRDGAWQYERAQGVFSYFAEHYSNGEYIAAVTHAGFLNYLVMAALGLHPQDKRYKMNFYNTGVTKIIFYVGGVSADGARCKIDYLNDAWHLRAENCPYLRGS